MTDNTKTFFFKIAHQRKLKMGVFTAVWQLS